jgi:acetylornithine deacetylase/succinyl-diaminopimelate desuccinylase-like protein
MKTSQNQLLSFLLIIAILLGIFYFMMPQTIEKSENSLDKFSTKRALEKVKTISQNPHYVGSKNHEVVAHYLVNELKELGLSPEIQEGYTFSEGGTLVKAKNIVGKIKGSQPGKALLLLSHYDSAPHSKSKGASDDASGIATILESVRAFNHQNIKPKNDIIILFSDAEEIGLNGAALFVTQHNWAKDVGLVLNFEARGSSGPSYMLLETNRGNDTGV